MRTRAWLRQWAIDYRAGLIFTSDMLGQQTHLINVVFMPLGLMDDEQLGRWRRRRIGLIYGYHRDSLPRYINGFPMLSIVGTLTPRECEVVNEIITQLQAAEDSVA